jgi:hypothetical protein
MRRAALPVPPQAEMQISDVPAREDKKKGKRTKSKSQTQSQKKKKKKKEKKKSQLGILIAKTP